MYTIVGGKRVLCSLGGKRVFIIVGGKGVFATGKKEFLSYAAKVRVAKDWESTELQPYKRDHIVQIVPFLSILN